MGNGKITKELKGLGTTINGKEPSGETVSEVINGISNDYEGGSGATYTAGNGIEITEENVINNTQDVVVANPTLTGTETELTGLQVGNTKFKVSGEQKSTPYLVAYADILDLTNAHIDLDALISSLESKIANFDSIVIEDLATNSLFILEDIVNGSSTTLISGTLDSDNNYHFYVLDFEIPQTIDTSLTLKNALLSVKNDIENATIDFTGFATGLMSMDCEIGSDLAPFTYTELFEIFKQ